MQDCVICYTALASVGCSFEVAFLSSMVPSCSALKMEAAGCSKMLVPVYQTTWHCIPLDCTLPFHRCENFKADGHVLEFPAVLLHCVQLLTFCMKWTVALCEDHIRPSVYDPIAAAELFVRLSWISLWDFLTESCQASVCVISSLPVILCPRV